MVGGGNAGTGHCTGEVVVDGSADIQIQGDTASVRDVQGSQPQIRRFECTSAMPPNAPIRVNVNGRGRSRVVQQAANGGPEVIRIEDSEGGASVYQFDLSWGNSGFNQGYNQQGYPPPVADRRDMDRGWPGGSRFTREQAINVCRDAVRRQAIQQFGARDVNFDNVRIDDNPGRRDWVVGTIDVRRGPGRDEYPFSCSVNFDTGRVRSAQIEERHDGYAGRDSEARGMDKCRDAVLDRLGGRVDVRDMRMSPDGDTVRGSAWSRGMGYDFSCRVSRYDGDVRDVNVSPRR